MSCSYSRIKYSGTAPIGDSSNYTLFDSTVAFPGAGMAQGAGVHKLVLNLVHSQAGSVLWQRSSDRGATWTTVDTEAKAIPAAGESSTYEGLVEPFLDFKLVWTNGGVAQATWVVDMALTDERGASS